MYCLRAPCLCPKEGQISDGALRINGVKCKALGGVFSVSILFRFILKTCGTTTPLDCIDDLTRLVKEYAGFDTVEVNEDINLEQIRT